MGELLSRFVWPKYGRKSFVAVLCKAVEVIGDLLTPLIIARMIDLGIHGANMYDIIRYSILLVVIAIVGFSFTLLLFLSARELTCVMNYSRRFKSSQVLIFLRWEQTRW